MRLIFMFFYLLMGASITLPYTTAHADPASANQAEKPALTPEQALAITPDDYTEGQENAPVTVVEYYNLSCSHCADFYTQSLPVLRKDYIETGKVRMVYRNLFSPQHKSAANAAILTQCAPRDQFKAFVGTLFKMQRQWAFSVDPTKDLETIAGVGGVSPQQFAACIKDKAIQNRLFHEVQAANNVLKVESTPTFFVNGTKLEGADWPRLRAMIDDKLKQAQ